METHQSSPLYRSNAGTRIRKEYILRPPIFLGNSHLDDCVHDYHLYDDGLGKVEAMVRHSWRHLCLPRIFCCLRTGVLLWC